MKYIEEAPRQTPVVRNVDVLVVGGGTAGIPAAVAAARNGARTLLVECNGYLGGYWVQGPGSSKLGIIFQDTTGRQIMKGINQELMDRMVAIGGAVPALDRTVITTTGWPPATPYGKLKPHVEYEAVRTVAFDMCEEAGVELLLHTWMADAIVEGDALKGVVVINKSGRQAVLAKVVVDCTGDGDVAARAGAEFTQAGKEELYQISRNARLGGVDTAAIRARAKHILAHEPERVNNAMNPTDPSQVPAGFAEPVSLSFSSDDKVELSEDKLDYRAVEGRGGGISAYWREGIGYVSASVDGLDGTDAFDLTRAEVELRKQIVGRFKHLKESVPGYENSYLLATGESINIGVRETRQITGDYVFTGEDIVWGHKFDDAILKSAHGMDMHKQNEVKEVHGCKADFYEVPYRCIVPKRVDNLLVAGRCISCDHDAEAALRKVPVCVGLGEAAGTAAALAAKAGVTPRRLDVTTLQAQLTAQGAW